MKVSNIVNPRGNTAPNQFIIEDGDRHVFQSYNSIIAVVKAGVVTLDPDYWDYSVTTLKYLKIFLGTDATKKEIIERIESGRYKTRNLNR